MNQPYLLKNTPAPLRMLIQPMLLISLGLHGMFLLLPLPSESEKPQPPKEEEEQVKITKLAPSPQASPKLTPKTTPKLTPTPQTKSTPRTIQPNFRTNLVIPPIPQPKPSVVAQPRPTLTPTPEPSISPTPEASASPTPEPSISPTPEASASPTPEPSISPVQAPVEQDPFANFPIYPGAGQGSLGLFPEEVDGAAYNTADGLDKVFSFFSTKLPEEGFESPQSLNDRDDLRVYKISKNSESQVLHLIAREGNTVIFLAPKVVDLASLKSIGVETAEEREFRAILEGAIDLDLTVQLTDELRNQFEGVYKTDLGKLSGVTPEELHTQFESVLGGSGFVVTQLGNHAGGSVYQVTKNSFTGYLSLVPVETGIPGTAIFLLKGSPL
ncbi:hypothetical protein [Lyngbya aestuarii]|uniref:hypothetical protein n=1 Tax=Lyngbya aestuarii TaxID=118322 RepID=UPI00403E128E